MKAIEIKKDIYWVGALDADLRIFDIVMYTPYGTTYNSYVVKGSEKTAVFETVKEKFFDQYIERLRSLNIDVEKIDYIVVDHTEPDHAGSVAKILDIAKDAKVIGSAAALKFLKAIANRDFESITVSDGDVISLGNKTLKFISAPFLHWPDSIYTFVEEDNILLTCDSFGSHYCSDNIFNDKIENKTNYMEALKYYFDCIMGPFKPYVLKAIDKIKDLNIQYVCPGHGPILRDNPQEIIELYKQWSTPEITSAEIKKIAIAYVSAYGYTKQLSEKICEGINSKGKFNITAFDVTYSKIEDIMSSIDAADGVLFGSPTINGDALKPIWDIVTSMNPIVHGKKIAAAFGSYGWSGEAVRNIEDRLKQLRLNVLQPGLRINFKPSDNELLTAYKFGEDFADKVLGKKVESKKEILVSEKNETEKKMTKWKCVICGLVLEATEPPEVCPACGAGSDQFIEVNENKITFKSEKNENFIIVGNGTAGFKAAQALRERNSVCSIEIISSESYRSYYRPQLSDLLSSEIPDNEFYLAPINYYAENNIKLTLNSSVKEIIPSSKKIILCDGSERNYHKLILANGSSSYLPPLKGTDKKGVHVLKYLEDALEIKTELKETKNAVVIGGGLLGLEAAWEIMKQGIHVTVVEFCSRLLPSQLDDNGSALFEKLIATSGVDIILNDSAEEILGNSKLNSVKLKSGRVIECGLVLFSVGIRPNIAIAEKAGLKVRKGIIVNEKMETSVNNIYACGDVAELNGLVYGNWPAAQEMGTVAGVNASGDSADFTGFVPAVVFNAMNTQLFSCGKIDDEASIQFEIKDLQRGIYKKMFFSEDKLIGGILIGDTSHSVELIEGIQNGSQLLVMSHI